MKRFFTLCLTAIIMSMSATVALAQDNNPFAYTANPADKSKVTEIRYITVTFPNSSYATVNMFGNLRITVTDSNNTEVTAVDVAQLNNSTNNSVLIRTPKRITADGIYKVNIPAGAVTLESGPNPAFSLTYTIGTPTAINAVVNNDGTVEIYDLSGRKLNTPVKGGVYILNGKKYINK